MFRKRVAAVREGKVKPGHFKTYQLEVPPEVQVLGNHYDNQFQIPVMFMITSIVALLSHSVTWPMVSLGILFVGTRIIHSYIHLNNNKLLWRMSTFFLGMLLLAAMWLVILNHLVIS